jgi:hypothetical protein
LYLIPICSEGDIVHYISAKHKLAWCFLQFCVLSVSNSCVTIQLIEGSNKIHYLLALLDFHDFFIFQVE